MAGSDILNLIQFNQYHFTNVLSYILVYLAILWLLFCIWVIRDISMRTKNILVILSAFFVVLIFNIPGLLLYLLLRPEKTIEDSRSLDLYHISHLDDTLTTCGECGSIEKKSYKFCTVCGKELNLACEYCQEQINPAWRNCGFCGMPTFETKWQRIEHALLLRKLIIEIYLIKIGRVFGPLTQVVNKSQNLQFKGALSKIKPAFANKVNVQIKFTNEPVANSTEPQPTAAAVLPAYSGELAFLNDVDTERKKKRHKRHR